MKKLDILKLIQKLIREANVGNSISTYLLDNALHDEIKAASARSEKNFTSKNSIYQVTIDRSNAIQMFIFYENLLKLSEFRKSCDYCVFNKNHESTCHLGRMKLALEVAIYGGL